MTGAIAPMSATEIALNAISLVNQNTAPNTGGGLARALGSMVAQGGGSPAIWQKTGAGATAWQEFVQSFGWISVKDYGATGDGTTDDTAAIQAANDAVNAQGGGTLFWPAGTYVVSQITMAANANVQWMGCGDSSSIKWTFNAAGGAGSMISISGGASRLMFDMLQFNGSGLTNPAASRNNHLIAIGNGSAAVEIYVERCKFTGMVASSGDGVNVKGSAGNLASRWWITDCVFDGCSRFGVGVEQGYEIGWICENYFTNNGTDIGVVAASDVAASNLEILSNQIIHTGTTRHAVRIEGPASVLQRFTFSENIIVGGFVTISNVIWGTVLGNVNTSGDFASTDGVWRVFGAVSEVTFGANLIDRSSGSSSGPCLTVEKATTSPTLWGWHGGHFINEKAGANFATIVDSTQFAIGGVICRSSNANASTMNGFDIQAVTVALTDCLVGPANQMTAAAGSMAACVRFLANGASITNASCVGNQGDQCDYGVAFEVGGGGGTFNGQMLYAGNNFDSTVGDYSNTGVTVRPRIGFNAGTFGAQYFTGTGSPEGVVTARIGSWYSRSDGGQASAVYYKESGTGNTGWIALGGDPIIFGADSLGTTTALFFAPGYIAAASLTEIQFTMPRAGTIRNLYVQIAAAGTDSSNVTYTVRKGGVDTTLTTSKNNNTSGQASDLTHSFTVAAGDLISISITKAGVVTAGQTGVTATIELA